MQVQQRINLLALLGDYMKSDDAGWQVAMQNATAKNAWFTPEFIRIAVRNIADQMLQKKILEDFAGHYTIQNERNEPKKVGIVMAGNIPLVGFHDFLCCFLSGQQQLIKLSEKDDVLLKHLIEKMIAIDGEVAQLVQCSVMLKNCAAYIATGSNNSARYFEQYFGKYPHLIRKNKTAVGILSGKETEAELLALADDVHLFFGFGCRNVSKIFVPENYDFVPLLNVFRKYHYFADHHKYKNNYDYQLAIAMINKLFYMTNESILLIENESVFSPISQLHYSFYTNKDTVIASLHERNDLQCILGEGFIPFGSAQQPLIHQFADGVDTMEFLLDL
jgi:hypothetical protein